ncbi:MAG: hypothetical protein M5U26_26080 [Planctomycetota bacterium]|nr:hypothetical protein [Planctomycetota bacterium]
MPARIGLLVLVLFALAGGLRAEELEKVVVTYQDGRKEEAQLVKYDDKNLVLRVSMKGNALDLTVPWAKVKELSNGLTPELIQKRWAAANKDKLCPTCKGEKSVACAACDGSGFKARERVSCTACKGAGTSACQAQGCEAGKVTCPDSCLKLSEGKWELGKDNLRWRRFTFGGAWMEWSERHLGEVIAMEDGKPVNKGKCATCGGTTKVNCAACAGAGQVSCAACKGTKEVPKPGAAPACGQCQKGRVACAECKGAGIKEP